jgi:hypothetical protein
MEQRAVGAEPQVTVVIPALRCSPTLDECRAHLDRQTYRNFDVVVDVGPDAPNAKRLRSRDPSYVAPLLFLAGHAALALAPRRFAGVARGLCSDPHP